MMTARAFFASALAVVLGLFCLAPDALAQGSNDIFGTGQKTYTWDGEDYDGKPWEENKSELPPYPQDEDFYSFYVSASTVNSFYVDTANITLGNDGVVRYTLLIITPAGVRNVSHEGMRCENRQRRTYALGRPDGRWNPSRGSLWVPVREATSNRHYAALYLDFFCPNGIMPTKLENVVRAIKKEGKPLASKR